MSDKPKDELAEMIERRRQLFERMVSGGAAAEELSGMKDEFIDLSRKILTQTMPTREQCELISFAEQLRTRQGTKTPDFKALYEKLNEMDRKLMASE